MSSPKSPATAHSWKAAFAVASATHVGMRRRNNQDNFGVFLAGDEQSWNKLGHLLIVADGMGAHAAGELASQLSVELIPHHYRKLFRGSYSEALRLALTEANAEIFRRGQANPEFRSMGTTTCTLAISNEGAFIAHVGDSRVYRLRGELLEQLTFDHSLVWEMRASGELSEETLKNCTIPKNVITRSLGPNSSVAIDIEGPFPLRAGDKYLMCSDGLSGQLSDAEIGVLLQVLDRDQAVQAMVDIANLRGGPDNITVVIGEVLTDGLQSVSGDTPQQRIKPISGFPVPFGIASIVSVLLACFLLLLGHVMIAMLVFTISIAIVAAGWHRYRLANSVGELPPSTKGVSPYRRVKCKPDASFTANLAQVATELESWFNENRWTVGSNGLAAVRKQASDAENSGNYGQAIKSYVQFITQMMKEARRHQAEAPHGTEAIDL